MALARTGWRPLSHSKIIFQTVIIVAFAVLAVVGAGSGDAFAQDRVERRSIIDFLFGPRPSQQFPEPPPRRAEPRRQSPAPSRQAAPQRRQSAPSRAAAAPSPAPSVDKSDDASRILVVGDFMAAGLADGLEQAFAENSDIVVMERANGSSGLVRDDFYDWPAALPGIIEETEPDIVVVMLGSNDRQQLTVGGQSAAVRTDAWNAEYASRVAEVADIVTQRGLGLVWVGAPAFEPSRMTADILEINEIYREKVEEAGGAFVDIWDGFVDENGKFIFTGSDFQGQQARLRGSDGITMTQAGKRKLAFYAERPIKRLLDERGGPSVGMASTTTRPDDGSTDTARPAAPQLVTRTAPMRITDPSFDGGETLMGGDQSRPARLLRSPRDELVEDGIAAAAPAGRADNFVWPPERRERPTPAASGSDDTGKVKEDTASGDAAEDLPDAG